MNCDEENKLINTVIKVAKRCEDFGYCCWTSYLYITNAGFSTQSENATESVPFKH